jgi:carboxylesterase type B
VYTPEIQAKSSLPVIFWIYGGAFFGGDKDAFGPGKILDRDVVLVRITE